MEWFKNFRTMTKLMLAFSLMAGLIVVVGYEGMSGMSDINTMLNSLYARDMIGLSEMKEARIALGQIGREARQIIIDSDPAAADATNRRIEAQFSGLKLALAEAKKTLVTEAGKREMEKVENLLPEYQTLTREIARLGSANQNAEATKILGKARDLADQIGKGAEDLARMKETLGKEAYQNSDATYGRSRLVMLCVIGVAIGLSLGMGLLLARLISGPLSRTVTVLEAVAGGDMTQRLDVSTRDEVGQMATALNAAVEGMRSALVEVRSASDNVSGASQQLASGSEELSSGAQEQAASLEETSASLEEITISVRQNADSAKQANQLAAAARDSAERGGQVVSSAVTAMNEINASSKKIADIITAIDEIAFQTNLLALNAAVEAARAGEQGRGFAVVAAEVRNLAQRSASAAKEIKSLISDSVRKVETGSEMVNNSGAVLLEIVSSVKRVTDIVGEIAAASQEQATGVEQVSKAMGQMDQVTQQNASQTEELSATAQSLSSAADQLQSMVARFRLGEEQAGRRTWGPGGAQSGSRTVAGPRGKAVGLKKLARTLETHREQTAEPAPEPKERVSSGFGEF